MADDIPGGEDPAAGDNEPGDDPVPVVDAVSAADAGPSVVDVGLSDVGLSVVPAFVPVRSRVRVATAVGLVAVAVFGGLSGLLGYRLYQARQHEQFGREMVDIAKQGATNLTSIDYQHADADVQRILDAASGPFYDDFKARSGPFIDVVKKVKSTSVGTVSEAGLESLNGQEGRVLVAVTVKTTNAGTQQEQPRYWRMRLTVTKHGDEAKVSQVEFVA